MMTRNQNLLCGLTALSLIAPLTSLAGSAFENGFYVGAKIGAQQALASWDQSTDVSGMNFLNGLVFDTAAIDQDGQSFHTNLMGNVGMGYAVMTDNLFLAAELSVNLAEEQEFGWTESEFTYISFPDNSNNINTVNQNIRTQIELENPDINLDLRPGFLLTKSFLLYGRIGVAYNKLSMEQNGDVTLTSVCEGPCDPFPFTSVVPVDSKESKDVYALRVGLGMEYKFTPNLSVNMDYIFTDYGSIDTELAVFTPDDATPIASTTTVNSSADVTKSTGTVGLNWYFGGKKHRPAYHGPDK